MVGHEVAPAPEAPQRRLRRHARFAIPQRKSEAARYRKIPLFRIIIARRRPNRLHHLRYQEVQVGIALPMYVRNIVDGCPAGPHFYILAMHRVEPAEENLMRLALSAVLTDEDARDCEQQLTCILVRRCLQNT